MDDWRNRLRRVVAEWRLSPEDQAAIVEELESHLEQQLEELTLRIGAAAASEHILSQIADPALRDAHVRPRHRPTAGVDASRRRAHGWPAIGRDLVYGWRSLMRSPGTTALAMIALALGIGLTTVMFSIIYGTLMRGLPFDNGNRIAIVERSAAIDGRDETLPMHEFFAFRDAQHSFESFGAYLPSTVNLSGDESPERITAARISASAMIIPKIRPLLGRLVQRADEDPSSALVVVLSYALWRDRYAGDSSVIGRPLRVNGLPATIVGVMPEGFDFPLASKVWIPLRLNAKVPWGTGPSVNGVGRLRVGVTFDEANAELARLAARIETEHRRTDYTVHAIAQPFVRAVIRSQVYTLLYAMFAAVGLVFLIACMNVANLLLARAAHRSKEVAVRRALGASRAAIARQFLVESFVLSLLAATLGALVAQLGISLFKHATADQFPFFADIRLHPQVFLFIACAAVLASVIAGLFPALAASGARVGDVLKDQTLGSSSLGRRRLSRAVVVFELVLSSALLIVAALTTKSLLNLRSVEPRFRTNNILTARVTLTSRDTIRNAAFFERLDDELSRLPGVSTATLSSGLPGIVWGQRAFSVEGHTAPTGQPSRGARHLAVTAGFFKTFDVTPLRGRGITAEDRSGSPRVAVVNQRFVKEYFPHTDPIGQRINLAPRDTVPRWTTVVGVIPDLYAVGMQDPWPAEIITSLPQEIGASASIAIHTDGDPTTVSQPLRTLVASLDRDLPVYSIATMQEGMRESTWPSRIFGGLFSVFAIVALVLASIGLYSVLAFAVRQRERELGIRMALGAARRDVMRLVFGDGLVQLAIGVPLGVLLGVLVARTARAVLFGVQPTDPVMVGVVVATLGVVGISACVFPALRAAKADPLLSLRAE